MLMKDSVAPLPRPPISYGKAAIVGISGEIEHGAAAIYPRLGKPIRDAVGGGEAIISLKRQDRRTRHVDRRAARP